MNISRRKFFKLLGATVVSGVAIEACGPSWFQKIWNYLSKPKSSVCVLTNEIREAVIAQALNTTEGRAALAQAMVEPIRRSLDYQAVGRKLLLVDELPQGALAGFPLPSYPYRYKI